MREHRNILLFLVIWLTLNIVTAVFTELYSDEAYYWMYSQFPEWGYFDHPPMIALLIKMGSVFGHNEMAVRMFPVLLLTVCLGLLYSLCQPLSLKYFALSIFSMLSLNLIGFMSLPDLPFLSFGILFLFCYRSFLINSSSFRAVGVGIVAAALIYSKYHGVLIIIFTILSNLKLLSGKYFYVAVLTFTLLLIPHLLWQWEHHFPSIVYHLVDRNTLKYEWGFTAEYILGSVFFHGPLASVILLFAAARYCPKNSWDSCLKWNLFGTLIFFFLMSFHGHIEANWTLFMIVPMLILGLREIQNWKKLKQIYLVVCCMSVLLLLVVRIHLISPLIHYENDRVWDFHGAQFFADRVYQQSGQYAVTANRYQEAAALSFYRPEGTPFVPALNIDSRANQYSIWKLDTLVGKKALFVNNLRRGKEIRTYGRPSSWLLRVNNFPTWKEGLLDTKVETREE